jgi:hypothetical protein
LFLRYFFELVPMHYGMLQWIPRMRVGHRDAEADR